MAQIHDYLAGTRGEDGAATLPEDEIMGAYDADMSVPNAKIEAMTTELATTQAELLATKAANWDLIQQIPAAEAETTAESDPVNSENDDPEDVSIDDFFATN